MPQRADIKALATANLVTHFTWVQRQTTGMQVDAEAYRILTDSGLPCDTFNAICQANFTADHVHEQIRAAIDHFVGLKRPFSWWLSPGDQPDQLVDLLLDAGLERDYSEDAMAADLRHLAAGDLAPNNLQIRRVQTKSDLDTFARLISGMWSPPDPEVVRFYDLGVPAILRPDSPMWFYVGYVDDVPVATAEVTVSNGVAGLYNICTLPDFRGRGYGSAMTLQPLVDARAANCTLAILQATEAGARVYKRLGFESFGTITEYKPPPALFALEPLLGLRFGRLQRFDRRVQELEIITRWDDLMHLGHFKLHTPNLDNRAHLWAFTFVLDTTGIIAATDHITHFVNHFRLPLLQTG